MSTTPPSTTKPTPDGLSRKRLRQAFLWGVGSILGVGAALTGYIFAYNSLYVPHTTVAGVAIGGKTQDQAAALLADRAASYAKSSLTITYQGKQWNLHPADIGVSLQVSGGLTAAWQVGRQGNTFRQFLQRVAALVRPHAYVGTLSPLTAEGEAFLQKNTLQTIEVPVHETTLRLIPNGVTIIGGQAGKKLDTHALEVSLTAALQNGGPVPLSLIAFQPTITTDQAEGAREAAESILATPWEVQASGQNLELADSDIASWLGTAVNSSGDGLVLTVNIQALHDKLQALATTVNTDPQNAHLTTDASGVVSVDDPGHDGQHVDLDKTAASLVQAWTASSPGSHTISATVAVTPADVSSATLASLGITQKIGTATTNFAGSPVNRIFNIKLGQSKLNGILLNDTDTFSTISHLAPVDTDHGYKEELVIKGDRTSLDAGGGLCQVSTTLFRAVLNAGLPIVSRTPHSYRVSYYEVGVGPGLDATVFDPAPDFKWKNDTKHAIYVQSSVSGNNLTFDLYGTSDGRTSTISAPVITNITPPGDDILIPDPTMYKDEKKQVEHPHPGATTDVTYSVMRGGTEIRHVVFHSVYKPWPAQFLVGTMDRPAATPTPAPVQ